MDMAGAETLEEVLAGVQEQHKVRFEAGVGACGLDQLFLAEDESCSIAELGSPTRFERVLRVMSLSALF